MRRYGYELGEALYTNPLASEKDISSFRLEGKAVISFPRGRMRMENALASDLGQKANYVLWCPESFPSDICAEWDFMPIKDPGLSILFFAAEAINGGDIFAPDVAVRTGEYPQYHHGDINAFHVSYFRRKEPDERAFHTCNLRKSYGFHLVAQGGDPIPDADEVTRPYKMAVVKHKNTVAFFCDGLEIFRFNDDGSTCGPLLGGGRIGFRQLAPMIAEYANLEVYPVIGE